ncbi:hypothetical protein J6590_080394 [Homalodisca vitripennis]|nr:hypothetical protein J6590_080394 [Homalodisca vitripennis]
MVLDLGHLTLPPCLPPPSPFRWGLFVGGRPLCGTQRSVDVLLQRPHTLISFRGNREGGDGFNITVKQQECKSRQTNTWCGGNYSGENVLILSPGYPTGYPGNLDCKYRIIPSIPGICQMEVRFEESALEESINCTKDSLQINGERLCGELLGPRIYEVGDSLEIRFITDSEGNDKGFRLTTSEKLCTDSVPLVINEFQGDDKQDVDDCIPQDTIEIYPGDALEGYNYPKPYPPFSLSSGPAQGGSFKQHVPIENSWVNGVPLENTNQISPPSKQDLKSNNFDTYFGYNLAQVPNMIGDLPPRIYYPPTDTRIPVGYERSSPFYSRYPWYSSPGFSYKPTAPQSPMHFFWPPSTGFGTTGGQCCSQIYSDSHFLIVSPGFPRSQSSDCIYTVSRYSPLTAQLRFQFRYFWTGEDIGTGCSGGYLEIDGTRVCGCKTGVIWTSQFFDSENSKTLHLRLDSSSNKLFNGFVIEVYQDDSYSQRYKRTSGVASFNKGSVSNLSQYIETTVERNPVPARVDDYRLDGTSEGFFVWEPSLQSGTPPNNFLCLRWNLQDWLLLIKESLWARYQCPVPSSSSVSTIDVSTSSGNQDVPCRTCLYFCRQKCECC